MLFLDGVYAEGADGRVRFLWVKVPASAELIQLAHTLAQRIGRYLERQGLLDRDADDCKCRMRAGCPERLLPASLQGRMYGESRLAPPAPSCPLLPY